MSKTNKINKPVEFVYFVFTEQSNASHGFSTYTDHTGQLGSPGATVSISYGLDKFNKPTPFYFTFSMKERVIKVPKNRKDIKDTDVVEFLRNHPQCKDSPNGTYNLNTGIQEDIIFKEMNEEGDAEIALKAKMARLNAENIANNLELADVFEINAILGIFKQSEAMARHALLEVAGNKPSLFMGAYENPQRKTLSLIRKALDKRVLTTQGTSIVWNKTIIGLDETDAAVNLMKEPKMIEALDSAIKKVS